MVKDIERIVSVVLDKITASLAAGDRVEFRGFGTFSVRTRTPRVAKNPRTASRLRLKNATFLILRLGNNYSSC